MYDRPVYKADRTDVDREDLLGPVEADRKKMLLHPGRVVSYQGIHIAWSPDLPSFRRKTTPSELKGGDDNRRFCRAQPLNRGEFFLGDSIPLVKELHHFTGDRGDGTFLVSASDENRQQFLVTQRFGPALCHPLTGAVMHLHLLDPFVMGFGYGVSHTPYGLQVRVLL